MGNIDKNGGKLDIMMVRKIVQELGTIQIRTLAKNEGIVQIGGKFSENRLNSKWGILDFRMGNFECSPF